MSKQRTRLRTFRPEQLNPTAKLQEGEQILEGPIMAPPVFGLAADAGAPSDEDVNSNPFGVGLGIDDSMLGGATPPDMPSNFLGGEASAYSTSLGFGTGLYGELGPEAQARAEYFSETLTEIRNKPFQPPSFDLEADMAQEVNNLGQALTEGLSGGMGNMGEGPKEQQPQEVQEGLDKSKEEQKGDKKGGENKKKEGKEKNEQEKKTPDAKNKAPLENQEGKKDAGADDGGKKAAPAGDGGKQPAKRKPSIQGLPSEVASKLESVLGMDLSSVKIKPNSSEATAHGAKALAKGGSEVHFAPGQFNPGSKQGQEMIAHEFGHIKQQAEGKVKATGEELGKAVNTDTSLEGAADKVASDFANAKAPTSPDNFGGAGVPRTFQTPNPNTVPMVSQFMRDGDMSAYNSLLGMVQARKAAAQASLDGKKQAFQSAVDAEKQNIQSALQEQAARVDEVIQGGVEQVQQVAETKSSDAQSQGEESISQVESTAQAETEKVNALVDTKKEELITKGDEKAEKLTQHGEKEATRMTSKTASNVGKLSQAVASASAGANGKEGVEKLLTKANAEAAKLSQQLTQFGEGVSTAVRDDGTKNAEKLKGEAQDGASQFDTTRQDGAKAIEDKKQDSVQAIEGNVEQFISTLEGDTSGIVSEIQGKSGELSPEILKMGEGAIQELDSMAQQFAQGLDQANQQSMAEIDAFVDQLAEVGWDTSLISQVMSDVESFFSQQEAQLSSATDGASGNLGQISTGVSEGASGAIDQLQSGMDQVSSEFEGKADTKFSEVKSENTKVTSEAKEQMGTVSTNMEPEFDKAISDSEAKWDENVTEISEKMTEKVDDGLEEEDKTVSSFESEIQKAFSQLPDKKEEQGILGKVWDAVKSVADFVIGVVEGIGMAIAEMVTGIISLLSMLKTPLHWILAILAVVAAALLLIAAAALLGITVGTLLMIIGAVIGVITALVCIGVAIFGKGMTARERGQWVGKGLFEGATAFLGTGVFAKVGKLGSFSKWGGHIAKSRKLAQAAGGWGNFMRMAMNVPADDLGRLGSLIEKGGDMGKLSRLMGMASDGKQGKAILDLLDAAGDVDKVTDMLSYTQDAGKIMNFLRRGVGPGKFLNMAQKTGNPAGLINALETVGDTRRFLDLAGKTKNLDGVLDLVNGSGDAGRVMDLLEQAKKAGNLDDMIAQAGGDINQLENLLSGGDKVNDTANTVENLGDAASTSNKVETAVDNTNDAANTVENTTDAANTVENGVDAANDVKKVDNTVDNANTVENGVDAANDANKVDNGAGVGNDVNTVENAVDTTSDAGKVDEVADAGKVDDVDTPPVHEKPPRETWHPATTEEVSFGDFKYSQSTAKGVTGDGTPLDEIVEAMRKNGWDYTKEPPKMVEMPDGSLVSLDHRRLVAAQKAGITEVPITRVSGKTPIDADLARARDFTVSKKASLKVRTELANLMGKSEPLPKGYVAQTWEEAIMLRSARQGKDFPLTGSPDLPTLTYPKGTTPPGTPKTGAVNATENALDTGTDAKNAVNTVENGTDAAKTADAAENATDATKTGPVAENLSGSAKDTYNQLEASGLKPVEEGGQIKFYQGDRVVAELRDGQYVFKYEGYGGDIVLDPDKATTFIGKYIEDPNNPNLGTRYFLGSPDAKNPVEGLANGSFTRGEGYNVPKNRLNSLDVPQETYQGIIDDGIATIRNNPKYKDLPEEDIIRMGTELGNKNFWDQYNQPFLEEAFNRGDDVRLISDPETFNSGYYGRELEEITKPGGLAERYGYQFDEASSTWKKVDNGTDGPGGTGAVNKGPDSGSGGSGGVKDTEVPDLENAWKDGWNEKQVLDTPKGERPAPSEYLDDEYIKAHIQAFDEQGGAFIAVSSWVEGSRYPSFPLKKYVMLKSDMENAIATYRSSGKITDLEDALGYSRGDLEGLEDELYVFFLDSKDYKFEIPDGNEIGANSLWEPGGQTSGGFKEATIVNRKNPDQPLSHDNDIGSLQAQLPHEKL